MIGLEALFALVQKGTAELKQSEYLRLCVKDGFFNLSRRPGLGGVDKGVKNRAGEGALVVAAFRMPLDGEDEMGIWT